MTPPGSDDGDVAVDAWRGDGAEGNAAGTDSEGVGRQCRQPGNGGTTSDVQTI